MILLENIFKTFISPNGAIITALKEISLEVKQGDFVSIVGPSRCGKTTLLNIVAGLIEPTYARVWLNGQPIDGHFGWAGYMTQRDTLFPWRKVKENAEIGLEIRRVPKAKRQKRVKKLLSQAGLNGFENKYPFEISGGMKKRMALIRTLAYDPDVLLLDEPFAALDCRTREFLQAELLQFQHGSIQPLPLVELNHAQVEREVLCYVYWC